MLSSTLLPCPFFIGTAALAFAIIVFAGATQILLGRKPAAGRTLPGPIPPSKDQDPDPDTSIPK